MELVPGSRHMAALATPDTKGPTEIDTLRSDAATRGIALSILSGSQSRGHRCGRQPSAHRGRHGAQRLSITDPEQ